MTRKLGFSRLIVSITMAVVVLTAAWLLGDAFSFDRELFSLSVVSMLVATGALLAEALGVTPAIVEVVLGVAAGLVGVPASSVVDTLGLVGSVFIMYMAGLEVDLKILMRNLKISLAAGLTSFAVPTLTALAALRLLGYSLEEALLASIGVATTSVAVVYAITRRSGLLRRPLGQIVLATAMTADVASILAFVAVMTGLTWEVAAYFAGMTVGVVVVSKLLEWTSGGGNEVEMRLVLGFLVGASLVSEYVGVHAILFAFLLGVATRETIASRSVYDKLSALTFGVLAPIFFINAGLHAAPSNPLHYLTLSLVLVLASLPVKIAAAHVMLRLLLDARIPVKLTTVFGARLTVSAVIAFTGMTMGILSRDLAGAVILSSLIATLVSAGIAGAVEVE